VRHGLNARKCLPGLGLWRMSRVPWNFGGGPMGSGDVHEVILHEGSDSFANLALESVA